MDALDVSLPWQRRLARSFGDTSRLLKLLERAGGNERQRRKIAPVSLGRERRQAEARAAELLAAHGLATIGGRTAEEIASAHRGRIRLHHGFIEAAPDGPFDGACSLLTFHFIPRDVRRETLREIRRRLKPGAPFVIAHVSFDQHEPARSQWIARHVGFAGTDPAHAEAARHAIATRLSVLSPEDDEAMLRGAGFDNVSLFYAGLSFRGWVGYA